MVHRSSNMYKIRQVAKAYYNGAKVEDKTLAKQFFKSLDENGDGKVSLEEFKKKVDPSFSSERNFRLLDENRDGTLDFEEVLSLYYMNKVSIPSCSACRDVLLDSYFSCLRCQGKTSYRLCCDCYGRRKFQHHHPSDDFADTRALIKLLEQLMGHEQVVRDILEEMRNDNANRNANSKGRTSSAFATAMSVYRAGKATKGAFDIGSDMIDAKEAFEQVRDMNDAVEAAKDEGIVTNDAVEAKDEGIVTNDAVEAALEQGIDMNDNVEALCNGIDMIDMLDTAVDVAATAASCSIM